MRNTEPTLHPRGAAQRLVDAIPEVVALWEERLRREVSATRRQSRPALIDTLPVYLEQMSRAIATGGANREEMEDTARRHAAERAQLPGFSLEQLLVEYSVLHRTLLDILERDSRLTSEESRVLNDVIERGIRDAASEYVHVQRSRKRRLTLEAERAQEQIDALLQSAKDGVATVDLDRRYIYMNDEAARILSAGKPPKTKEQLLGKTMSEEFPELVGDRFFWAQIRALETQASMRYEDYVPALGRWLEISIHPSPSALNLFFRDITAQKRAEEEIERGEARFRSAVESVKDYAIFLLDPGGHVASWNLGAERLKRYRAEEIIGKHFSVLYQPEDAAIGRPSYNLTVARIKGRQEDEWWRRRKDESRFWANVVITALYDESGHLVGFMKVIRDLTERKRREEEERFLVELQSVLSASASYDDSLRQIAELVVQARADWCVVVSSRESAASAQRQAAAHRDPAKRQLLERFRERHPGGITLSGGPARVLRTGRAELVTEVDEAAIDALVHHPEAAELIEALGMGSYLCVPLSARGRILGAVTFVSADPSRPYGMDDLKFAEEVGRRAALTIDAVQSQQLIRLREEVLATVSHDLKNPLSAILSSAELITREARPGESGDVFRKQVAIIKRSALRMDRLVSDLLDLAKMEAGRFTVERQRLDVLSLLGEVVEAHQVLARAKSITFEASWVVDRCEVDGDRDRLFRVFSNLIGNAIKFTPEGGQVTVRLEHCGDDVRFSVQDSGPGIAEEDRSRIFERYWQAGPASRLGTGIGLSIVKGIIEAHGGTIWVESEVGAGSTFFFTLPASSRATMAA